MFAAAVFAATMRGCGVGRGVGAGVRVAGVPGSWAMSTIGGISASAVSTGDDVSSTVGAVKTMLTPTMAIAPVRPWAHTQEDSVIEIAWSIKAAGRAAVR
jgi:hypothetical protein